MITRNARRILELLTQDEKVIRLKAKSEYIIVHRGKSRDVFAVHCLRSVLFFISHRFPFCSDHTLAFLSYCTFLTKSDLCFNTLTSIIAFWMLRYCSAICHFVSLGLRRFHQRELYEVTECEEMFDLMRSSEICVNECQEFTC